MRGFITTSDLIFHPLMIIGPFGLCVYGRCVLHVITKRGRATFLECIW